MRLWSAHAAAIARWRPRLPCRYEHVGARRLTPSSPSRWIPLGADRSRALELAGREPEGVTQGKPPRAARRRQRSGRGRGHDVRSRRPAQAGVELGRFTRRAGVHGKMTGAQAAAAALCCQGVPCVFGIPGRPEQRVLGRPQSQGRALPAGRPRGFGQRDGRRRGAGHRHGRRLLRRARSGIDQRPDRHRRGSLRQHPDRRPGHRHRSLARTPRSARFTASPTPRSCGRS